MNKIYFAFYSKPNYQEGNIVNYTHYLLPVIANTFEEAFKKLSDFLAKGEIDYIIHQLGYQDYCINAPQPVRLEMI